MNCCHCGAAGDPQKSRCDSCGALLTAGDGLTVLSSSSFERAAPTFPNFSHNEFTTIIAGTSGAAAPAPTSAGGPLQEGQSVGARYHIIRLIGLGGMGAVYQAWDNELGVAVALKIIRPEIAADPGSARTLEKRFKQELLLARQVTHQNVVRIHDLGEVSGVKYITMPYIEGEDLASVLTRERKLPLDRALKIARTTISGLAAAHAAGIVHRDLKPANLMIDTDGSALIMDFGIARSTGATPLPVPPSGSGAVAQPAAGHTIVGAIVGTIEYMAPEQAKAEPVDHRADIYAFGLIMYDMLSGTRRVERAESAIAELTSRIVAPPPRLRTLDPQIPPAVDEIVWRCLQPDVSKRYQTTRELVDAVELLDDAGRPRPKGRKITPMLAAAVATLFLTLISLTWWLAKGPAPVVQRAPVSVLVANFGNRTGDPLLNGIVEQGLAIGLEGASFVTMYPRGDALSTVAKVTPGATLDEAAARLVSRREGVQFVVAGDIARESDGYSISARVIDPASDPARPRAVAQETVAARSKGEVLKAIASLASRIRGDLGDTEPPSSRIADAETFTASSLEAMNAYMRGQELNYAGKQNEALAAYSEAVRLDPGLARAYAGMGVIYASLNLDAQTRQSYEAALKHIDRMSEREKFRTLGGYYLLVTFNYEKAVENYQQLVRLYPADDTGHANLAYAYLNLGNIPKAVEEGRKAIEIYPKNILQRLNYAMYAMYAGDFKTAVEQADIILKEQSSYKWAHLTLANSHAASGDIAAARRDFERLRQLGPTEASMAALGEADLALYSGDIQGAVRVLKTGIKVDEAQGRTGNAAYKYAALAEASLALNDRAGAASAAWRAAALRKHESVLFPAASVLIEVGQPKLAAQLSGDLANMLQSQTTAFAHLIAGEIAASKKDLADAVEMYRDAQKRHDTWFGHFLLGRVYFDASRFPEAVAEFDICVKRRGETTDLFFVNGSTNHYLPQVYYWRGRGQEALGAAAAARTDYEQFVAMRSAPGAADPLLVDAKHRLAPQAVTSARH